MPGDRSGVQSREGMRKKGMPVKGPFGKFSEKSQHPDLKIGRGCHLRENNLATSFAASQLVLVLS